MIRFFTFGLLALTLLGSSVAQGETPSRYDEMVKAPGCATTIRTMGTTILSLPYERATYEPQIKENFWAIQPDANLTDAARQLELGRLADQLTTIQKLVARNDIRKVSLVGFTLVGTVNYFDLYYAAETPSGPVMIRVSMFLGTSKSLIYGFQTFEGWDAVRSALGQVGEKAGSAVASVSYTPPKPGKTDKGKVEKDI